MFGETWAGHLCSARCFIQMTGEELWVDSLWTVHDVVQRNAHGKQQGRGKVTGCVDVTTFCHSLPLSVEQCESDPQILTYPPSIFVD